MNISAHHSKSFAFAIIAFFTAALTMLPCAALADEEPQIASEKSETVNVTANANGVVEKVEVEAALKNDNSSESLLDSTELVDVKGKDKASFVPVEGDIVWRADGENVTYTGATDKQLPITMYVTYRLNGLVVNPSEIVGKSGDVSIRYDFVNNYSFNADVNGSNVEMRMPFTCLTALMLNGENFTDVKVTNGKVISDDSDAIIMGYAMPGLKASLGPLAEKADIPEYIEVTAKTTDFSLKSSMTIVTAGLMSDLDIEGMGLEDLNDMSSGLDEGMASLVSGARSLTDGLNALADGASTLGDGANALADGASTLGTGASTLADGAKKLDDGAHGLAGGAGSLDDGASTLASGAKTVNEGVSSLAGGAGSVNDGASSLADGASSLSDGLYLLEYGKDGNSGLKGAAASAEQLVGAMTEVESSLNALADPSSGLPAAAGGLAQLAAAMPDDKTLAELESALAASDLDANTLQAVIGILESTKQIEPLSSGVSQASDGVSQIAGGYAVIVSQAGQLPEGLRAASDATEQLYQGSSELAGGAKDLSDGTSELASGAQELAEGTSGLAKGAKNLTEGTSELAGGAQELAEGTSGVAEGAQKLADGTSELADGARELADGTSELSSGAKTAADGSGELTNGLVKYDDEGISKLVSTINDDIGGLKKRIQILSREAAAYDTFSGKASGTSSSVKFIFETAAIEEK